MEENLTETVSKLLDYVEGMSDFAAQEAPLVAQEILNRAYLMATWQAAIGTVVLCVLISIFQRALKWKIMGSYEDEDEYEVQSVKVIVLLFYGAGCIIGVVFFFTGLYNLFFAVLCPRLVVLQYLKMFL